MMVNGVRLTCDPSGALWWAERRTLVLADLHLEKGSGLAAAGAGLLPPYDTRATLGRIEMLQRRYRPATTICLGDSFHDGNAGERLGEEDAARLRRLTAAADWIWIEGNHDPHPPQNLGGRVLPEFSVGGLHFRHLPTGAQAGEVAGHLHPKAAVRVRGRRLARRCFVTDGAKLVLPAFGAYAGGLCVLDPAFHALFRRNFHAWMLGENEVIPVQAGRLEPIGTATPPPA